MLAFLLLLALGASVLGATVFRDEVATAASSASMFVNNDAANPVPVVEQKPTAGDPGRSAFAYFENSEWGNSSSPHAEFTVPAGKRLVIESVSVQADLPTGQNMLSAAVQALVNGKLQDYFMAPTFTGLERLNLHRHYVASQQTTVYADAGTTVSVFAIRDSIATDGGHFNVSVQGHLIDCTAGPCS
jgi:hypothetical protein